METDDIIVSKIPKRFRVYVVLGALVVIQFTNGIVYTFGNMMPYLVSYMRWKVDPDVNSGAVVWLQSLMMGLPFSMLAGGYLEKKFGARISVFIGTTLYSGSIALSYFTVQWSLPWLILSFGLFSSMGMGIIYNCVLIEAQKWLPKRSGLASGLIAAGFASCAFLTSPIQTMFINPENFSPNKDGDFTQVELLERVPKTFLVLGGYFYVLQIISLIFVCVPKTTQVENREERKASIVRGDPNDNHGEDEVQPIVKETSVRNFLRSVEVKPALKSSTFYIISSMFMLSGIWVQSISGFYKAFGQTFIQDDFFLSTIISFASAINCLSRVLWGFLADHVSYRVSMSLACGFGCVMVWSLLLIRHLGIPMLYFFAVCAIFSSVGAIFTLIPYSAYRCFGPENFGIIYGFVQLGMSLGGFMNAIISQFLLKHIGLVNLFISIGFLMLLATMLALFTHKSKYGESLAYAAIPSKRKNENGTIAQAENGNALGNH